MKCVHAHVYMRLVMVQVCHDVVCVCAYVCVHWPTHWRPHTGAGIWETVCWEDAKCVLLSAIWPRPHKAAHTHTHMRTHTHTHRYTFHHTPAGPSPFQTGAAQQQQHHHHMTKQRGRSERQGDNDELTESLSDLESELTLGSLGEPSPLPPSLTPEAIDAPAHVHVHVQRHNQAGHRHQGVRQQAQQEQCMNKPSARALEWARADAEMQGESGPCLSHCQQQHQGLGASMQHQPLGAAQAGLQQQGPAQEAPLQHEHHHCQQQQFASQEGPPQEAPQQGPLPPHGLHFPQWLQQLGQQQQHLQEALPPQQHEHRHRYQRPQQQGVGAQPPHGQLLEHEQPLPPLPQPPQASSIQGVGAQPQQPPQQQPSSSIQDQPWPDASAAPASSNGSTSVQGYPPSATTPSTSALQGFPLPAQPGAPLANSGVSGVPGHDHYQQHSLQPVGSGLGHAAHTQGRVSTGVGEQAMHVQGCVGVGLQEAGVGAQEVRAWVVNSVSCSIQQQQQQHQQAILLQRRHAEMQQQQQQQHTSLLQQRPTLLQQHQHHPRATSIHQPHHQQPPPPFSYQLPTLAHRQHQQPPLTARSTQSGHTSSDVELGVTIMAAVERFDDSLMDILAEVCDAVPCKCVMVM